MVKKKKQIINVNSHDYVRLKNVLIERNIQWVQSVGEADPLCAQLTNDDPNCIGVLSEDTDMLTFGAQTLITGYKNNTNGEVIIYTLSDILSQLNMDRKTFIDLCIMCGCDYVDRLYKIGPKTALKLLRKYKNIETILDYINHKKHFVSSNYLEDVNKARTIFYHHY